MAVLLDQNTRPRHGGVWVEFFGLPAPVSSAPAAIALKAGVDIACGFCTPESGGRYRAWSPGRIPFEAGHTGKDAILKLTRQMAGIMEGVASNLADKADGVAA